MYDDNNLEWGFRFVILDDVFIALILIKIMESISYQGTSNYTLYDAIPRWIGSRKKKKKRRR
jgi:hypothetical protein